MDLIRVAANSRTTAVAGAIAGTIRDHGQANVQAIGAQAVSQATKAIAVARQFLAEENIELIFVPSMVDVDLCGEIRTALHMVVYSHSGNHDQRLQRPQNGNEDRGA